MDNSTLPLGRKNIIHCLLWLIALLSFQLSAQNQDKPIAIDKNIELIEHYYQKSSESLPHLTVVQLANQVISQRDAYNSDILAKTFVLLAETASNNGDMATAFQFAQDGLQINATEPGVRMRLHLKLAAANYTRGKFQLAQQHAEQVLAASNSGLVAALSTHRARLSLNDLRIDGRARASTSRFKATTATDE